MYQSNKTLEYLNTDLVWITMLVCLLVEVDLVSFFPIMDWQMK